VQYDLSDTKAVGLYYLF